MAERQTEAGKLSQPWILRASRESNVIPARTGPISTGTKCLSSGCRLAEGGGPGRGSS